MAAKKTAAAAPQTKSVDATFLNSFTQTLDEVEQAANGYGSLLSCVVTAEDDGVEITATYDGRYWKISF